MCVRGNVFLQKASHCSDSVLLLCCSVPQIYRHFGLGSFHAKWLKFDSLLQRAEKEVTAEKDVPLRLPEDVYQVT